MKYYSINEDAWRMKVSRENESSRDYRINQRNCDLTAKAVEDSLNHCQVREKE